MSLSLALQNALTGLSVNQVALDVTSSNITNANTDGYTKKTAELSTRILGQTGQGAGVLINKITRNIDANTTQQLREQNADYYQIEAIQNYAARTESLFGSLDSDDSFSADLIDFSNQFEAVAISPDDPIRQNELLNVATRLVADVRSASREIQAMRLDADQELKNSIDELNQDLVIIEDLNNKIAKNDALEMPIGDLQDQRDSAILRVNQKLDIRTFTRENNVVVVYTASGSKLVDGSVQTLDYTAITSIDPTVSYLEGDFESISLSEAGIPTDLTDDVKTGRLKGLIEARDEYLPNMAAELEAIAKNLTEAANKIHNAGTAYPPPNMLTGTTDINGTDQFYADGGLRLAVMDDDGVLVDYIDLDLAAVTTPGPTTINDVITAINGTNSVINGNTFDTYMDINIVDNRLVINAADANNSVALGQADTPLGEPTERVTGKDQNFSQFFGLNNFFVNNLENSNPEKVISGNTYTTTTVIAGTGNFQIATTDATGAITTNYTVDMTALGAGATITDLINDINGQAGLNVTASLRQDGTLKLEADDASEGIELRLLNPPATNTASGENALKFFDFQDPRHISTTIDIADHIKANPAAIATGTLKTADFQPPLADPIPMVTAGDASTAQRMADIFKQPISFNKAGSIGAITTTLPEYAGLFLANNARQTNNYTNELESRARTLSELELQNSAVSGVDIEQEMAYLIVLENAYNAAAQVIRVTSDMFEQLERLVA